MQALKYWQSYARTETTLAKSEEVPMQIRLSCKYCKTIVPYREEHFGAFSHKEEDVDDWGEPQLLYYEDYRVFTFVEQCAQCDRPLVGVVITSQSSGEHKHSNVLTTQVYPVPQIEVDLPGNIPNHIYNDVLQAKKCLPYSAQATAALARKAIHGMLVDKLDGKGRSFDSDIKSAAKMDLMVGRPKILLEAVQKCGNYSIHSNWNSNTMEVIQTSEDEADLLLRIAQQLAYHIYEAIPKEDALLKKIEETHEAKLPRPISAEEGNTDGGKTEGVDLV